MIRYVLPLLLLTAVLWAVVFALPKPRRAEVIGIAKQFVVALLVANGVLALVFLVFYLGGIIK